MDTDAGGASSVVSAQEAGVNTDVDGITQSPSIDKALQLQQKFTMLMTVVQTISAKYSAYKSLYGFILQKI